MAPLLIDTADDPRLADYLGLKGRAERADLFIAESEAVVARLVTSTFVVRSFLLTPHRYEKLKSLVDPVAAPVYLAPAEVMRAVAGFDVHRGVLASVERRPGPALEEVLSSARRLLVLEGSNDHENIGAVARSAWALGFDAMVLDPTCADPFARRAVRVSMGALLHLPVVRCTSWPDPLDLILAAGFDTWALTPLAEARNLFTVPVADRVALIAGAEGPGLSSVALARVRHQVRIPMHHDVDSLNLGHALAIAMAVVSTPK